MQPATARRIGIASIFAAVILYFGFTRWIETFRNSDDGLTQGLVAGVCILSLSGIGFLFRALDLHISRPLPGIQGASLSERRRPPKPPRRLKLDKRFATLPNYGFCCSLIYAPFAFFLMLTAPATQHGLYVHIIKDLSMVQPFPGAGPLVIRADEKGHYYLASKEFSENDLPAALEEALRLRGDKVVYVEGDPDVQYQSVVSAVDIIRGARAHVVLVSAPAKRQR